MPLPRKEGSVGRRGPLRFLSDLWWFWWRQFWRNQAPQMAAALSYRTIFSMVPVLVLSLVVFRAFAGDDGIRTGLHKLMDFAGLSEIELAAPVGPEETSGGAPVKQDAAPPAAGEPGKIGTTPPARGGDTGAVRQRLSEYIEQFVSKTIARMQSINFGLITVIGIGFFIYGALSLLIQIEQAFNQICRAPTGRRHLARLTTYWTLLTLGSIALFAGFWLGESSQRMIERLPTWAGWAASPLAMASRICLSWLLLVFAYTRMPNTRVEIAPAAVGALIGAVLWDVCKSGLAWFIGSITGAQSQYAVYGSVALLPLFLLWLYATWLIILFGLEVAFALQMVASGRASLLEDGEEARIIDPSIGVVLLRLLAKEFGAGRTSTVADLALRAGVTESVAQRVLEHLGKRGFVHRVPRDADTDAYTLARPAESVSAGDVLGAMHELSGGGAPAGADAGVLAILRKSQVEALSALTLASIRDS